MTLASRRTAFTLFIFDCVKQRMVAPESAIDPEDDQGHIDRHRKDEKGNRVEERLVARCDGRLFDLVDWYGDPSSWSRP